MKKVKWAFLILVGLLIISQFIRPARTNPQIDEQKALQASTQVPAEINAILDRSCNDCHSNKTQWPWYSNVAPVSWFLIHHVNEGRRELSFSEWKTYSVKKASRKLEELCEQVEKGEMPMTSYTLIHPEAKLSDADKKLLCDWSKQERARVLAGQ